MNILKENVLRRFELCNPRDYERIVTFFDIGDFETLFKLSDGSRIIFDELDESSLYLRPRDTDEPFLTEIEWKNELARKIRKKMSMRGMTNKYLAEALGISPPTVGLYAKGKRCPDPYMIQRMARVLGCPVSDLNNFDYLL